MQCVTCVVGERARTGMHQQKAREELEAKRARLDGRHGYLFSTVADKLAIEVEQIENFMLEGDQVSQLLATPLLFVYMWGRSSSARVDNINYISYYQFDRLIDYVDCVIVGDDREFL